MAHYGDTGHHPPIFFFSKKKIFIFLLFTLCYFEYLSGSLQCCQNFKDKTKSEIKKKKGLKVVNHLVSQIMAVYSLATLQSSTLAILKLIHYFFFFTFTFLFFSLKMVENNLKVPALLLWRAQITIYYELKPFFSIQMKT